jgi:hypothetical protein
MKPPKSTVSVRAPVLKKKLKQKHVVSLLSLLPLGNVQKNGKDAIVYHGTSSRSYQKSIRDNGILPIGKGRLGNGFYFTPSFAIAHRYSMEAVADKVETPVVLEILIRNADQLKVTLYTESGFRAVVSQTTKKMTVQKLPSYDDIPADIFASYVDKSFWQFIVRDPEIIDHHFVIRKAFYL